MSKFKAGDLIKTVFTVPQVYIRVDAPAVFGGYTWSRIHDGLPAGLYVIFEMEVDMQKQFIQLIAVDGQKYAIHVNYLNEFAELQ